MKLKSKLLNPGILIILFQISYSISYAQQSTKDFVIGDKIYYESKILHEKKIIVVIPPYDYKNSYPNEKFPVVYVLDPGNNLISTYGILNFYSNNSKIMPRMIVVGIVSNDREHDYLPVKSEECPTGGGADKFLDFIDTELTHYIDSNYPTTSERCIIGHSAGGLFAIYALVNKPDLFNSYIAIDPSMWYDDQSYVKKIPDFFKNHKDIKKSLFVSLSNEKDMGIFPLINELEKNAPAGFKWDYIHYKNETHNTLGFKSICTGFEMIYKDWKAQQDTVK
jgi:uncharacterized protein